MKLDPYLSLGAKISIQNGKELNVRLGTMNETARRHREML
jgi:hypothetical protein